MKEFISSAAAKILWVILTTLTAAVTWAVTNVTTKEDFQKLESRVSRQENFQMQVLDSMSVVKSDLAEIKGYLKGRERAK